MPALRRLAEDPENRLFGRMNRRRLDAEAIRDSLLAIAGRLDGSTTGASFADLAVPRRTVYLQVVCAPGPAATDFGRLFDRADPGSIVAERGESVVAPQALFFLNDPFVGEMAQALAARIAREEPRPARPASAGCTRWLWAGPRAAPSSSWLSSFWPRRPAPSAGSDTVSWSCARMNSSI